MSGIVQIVGQTSGVSHLLSVDSNGKLLSSDTVLLAKNAEIEVSCDAILAKNTELLTKNSEIEVSCDAILAKNTEILTKNSEIEVSMDALILANHADLIAIDATLGGTLSVSAPAISAVASALKSAQSVATETTEITSSLDMNGVRNVMIFGSLTDTSGSIKTQVSSDDSTFYDNSEQTVYMDSSGHFGKTMSIDARYVRWSYENTSGTAKVWTLVSSTKS
tara:strand:- start:1098 stop:1760 length:663 start_codon:yes stop_codon:yes gene_type:complete